MQYGIELGIGRLPAQISMIRFQMTAFVVLDDHSSSAEQFSLFVVARRPLVLANSFSRRRPAAGEAGADPLQHHRFHEPGALAALGERRGKILGCLVRPIELGRRQQPQPLEHGQLLGLARPDVHGDPVKEPHVFQGRSLAQDGVPNDRVVPLEEA